MKDINLDIIIKNYFSDWMEGYVKMTGFGSQKVSNSDARDQDTLNAFLKIETNFQVKFGGYLELELQKINKKTWPRYTVHSEMRVYKKAGRSDLSIHSVEEKMMRLNATEIKKVCSSNN